MESTVSMRGYKSAVSNSKAVKKTTNSRGGITVALRLLIVLALDIAAIASLVYVKGDYMREMAFMQDTLPALTVALGIVAGLGLVWTVISAALKVDVSRYPLSPLMLTGTSAIGFAVAFTMGNYYIGKINIIVALIVACVLFFVWHIYPHMFFAYSIYTAAVVMACMFFSSTYNTGAAIAVRIVTVAAAIAVGALVMAARKNGGKLGKFALCSGKADFIAPLATSVLAVVFAVLSSFVSGLAVYSALILLGSFLVITIIYTIKMI